MHGWVFGDHYPEVLNENVENWREAPETHEAEHGGLPPEAVRDPSSCQATQEHSEEKQNLTIWKKGCILTNQLQKLSIFQNWKW